MKIASANVFMTCFRGFRLIRMPGMRTCLSRFLVAKTTKKSFTVCFWTNRFVTNCYAWSSIFRVDSPWRHPRNSRGNAIEVPWISILIWDALPIGKVFSPNQSSVRDHFGWCFNWTWRSSIFSKVHEEVRESTVAVWSELKKQREVASFIKRYRYQDGS